MKTLRFSTKISKSGTIHIPDNSSLIDKEVDVIIMAKAKRTRGKMRAKEFVEKWAGFLYPSEKNDSKYEYLMEKYK